MWQSERANKLNQLFPVSFDAEELMEVREGTEIQPGNGCQLESSKEENGETECRNKCKRQVPSCVAYSYNSATIACTIVNDCKEVL